jgi:hypothetical protein
VALGSQGCTLGDFVLKDFTFASSGTGGISLLLDSQIIVNPSGSTPADLSVQFSTPGGFQAGSGQTAEYIVEFILDPLAPTIAGPIIDLGPNDPVTLTGEFCGDGTLTSTPNSLPVTCTGTSTTGIFPFRLQIAGTGVPDSVSGRFPILVTTMDNRLILDLTGPASADSFGWGANVTGGGPSSVPEPSTSFLLITALLALPWLRKKWTASIR